MTDETDIETLRERLEGADGERMWRGLEEVAKTEEFRRHVAGEFPAGSSEWGEELSRRDFVKLSAASLALAGVAGCEPARRESIVPYVRQPEEVVPGQPLYFASACRFAGYGQGILVETHTGRPTKIEGNPDHPAAEGATTPQGQASVLELYDPDRSRVVESEADGVSGWSGLQTEILERRQRMEATGGAGFHIVTGRITSPTLVDQIQRLLEQFPEATWHQFEPVDERNRREGVRRAFGRVFRIVPRFGRAAVVASFDDDFLGVGPGQLRAARGFGRTRRVREGTAEEQMSRLYAVESAPSLTGANADHCRAVRPREVERALRAVAGEVGLEGVAPATTPAVEEEWLAALAADLVEHAGTSIVTVGEPQPPRVHALAHAINDRLDNLGETLEVVESPEAGRTSGGLSELVDEIERGGVETLVVAGANPVYAGPPDLAIGEKIEQVDLTFHLGLHHDETAERCRWHVPRSHPLEAWGDVRSVEGTVSILQPAIEPLYNTHTCLELFGQFLGEGQKSSRAFVREYWQQRWESMRPGESFETGWQRALEEGVVPGTAASPVSAQLAEGFQPAPAPEPEDDAALEVVFRPDPSVWDGRFANNGWLQELPKPLTSLTWDNAALVAPSTAERLGIAHEQVVRLTHRGQSVEAPVYVMPGHPEGTVTCRLGYGRDSGGRVAEGVGFDAYRLRDSQHRWSGRGLEVEPTDREATLASVQHHHAMEGREIVKVSSFEEFREGAGEGHGGHAPESLHPEWSYEEERAWAMVIDQTLCIGCKACVTACQAENNIPIVGKQQVARGREMHWIRVDAYYAGDLDAPDRYFQPVPCMHCEKAPCEVVCPVAATTHSDEGINEMTYNRCIGTRYCSNNCPYKVRRFNFLDYHERADEAVAELQYNPDVTVRGRGVMEKCTYCVQRINDARRKANADDRELQAGEVVTACEAACPTDAIVFGDENNPDSRVAELKGQPHEYSLLAELNTRPRTTYLEAIEQTHPTLEGGGGGSLLHGAPEGDSEEGGE